MRQELVDGRPRTQGLLNRDDSTVGGHLGLLDELLLTNRLLAPVERAAALLQRTKCFIEGLGEVAAERHGLTDRLHGGGELAICQRELLKSEARNLHDHIVQCWLEGCRRDPSDVVRDFVESIAKRQLCGDLGNRETGRFGGQSGAPRPEDSSQSQ